MLSEIRQSQKDKSLRIPLIRGPYSSQIQRDKVEQRLSGWWMGNRELVLNGYRAAVLQDDRSSSCKLELVDTW